MEDRDFQSIPKHAKTYIKGSEKSHQSCSLKRQNPKLERGEHTQLPSSEGEDCEGLTTRHRHRPLCFLPLLYILLLLTLVLFTNSSLTGLTATDSFCHNQKPEAATSKSSWSLSVPNLTPSLQSQSQPSILHHCGNSTIEARSLGCIFQIWSYAWVPAPCYDANLDADFLLLQIGTPPPSTDKTMEDWPAETTGWSYFCDRGGTDIVPFDTVVKGESEILYTTWLQHMWHCAFTWRKMLKSLNGGGVSLTERDLGIDHTMHCSEMAVNAGVWNLDVVNDMLVLGFLKCHV